MNTYEEYAILDAQITALTNQKDELKAKIIEDMVTKGEDKVVTAVGGFKITMLKTWEYTDKVKELQEAFKARKAHEESAEIATYEEKPSLRFTSIKL